MANDEIRWIVNAGGELYVCFESGKTLVFEGVDEETCDKFMDADDMNEFFNKNINGHYEFAKQAA